MLAYYLQANDMIERVYKFIFNALSKMLDKESTNLLKNSHAVLWADRSTVHASTSLAPYYISCGNKLVLPIKLKVIT